MEYIYPTKGQRIQEEMKKIISNPNSKEDAEKNKQTQERIKKIKEVF